MTASRDFAPFFFVSAKAARASTRSMPVFQVFQQSQILHRNHGGHFLSAPSQDHPLLAECDAVDGVRKSFACFTGWKMRHG
jgi:hypothetical protein